MNLNISAKRIAEMIAPPEGSKAAVHEAPPSAYTPKRITNRVFPPRINPETRKKVLDFYKTNETYTYQEIADKLKCSVATVYYSIKYKDNNASEPTPLFRHRNRTTTAKRASDPAV